MAKIITELEALNETLEIKDPELGKGCLVVSEVTSEAPSRSSVADGCEIVIDRRLTWGESPEYALNQIKGLPGVKAADAKVSALTFTDPSYTGHPCNKSCIFPAWKLEKEHDLTIATQDAYEGLFNKKPVLTTWPFSTNGVSIMGMYGIPVIGYGPGTLPACHVPDEFVAKEQVLHACMMYSAIATSYSRNKASKG